MDTRILNRGANGDRGILVDGKYSSLYTVGSGFPAQTSGDSEIRKWPAQQVLRFCRQPLVYSVGQGNRGSTMLKQYTQLTREWRQLLLEKAMHVVLVKNFSSRRFKSHGARYFNKHSSKTLAFQSTQLNPLSNSSQPERHYMHRCEGCKIPEVMFGTNFAEAGH